MHTHTHTQRHMQTERNHVCVSVSPVKIEIHYSAKNNDGRYFPNVSKITHLESATECLSDVRQVNNELHITLRLLLLACSPCTLSSHVSGGGEESLSVFLSVCLSVCWERKKT